MCTGASFLAYAAIVSAAVGTAATMYSTDTQAKQQESNLKFQAAQTEADAKAAQGEAYVEAMRIRRQGKAQQGQAIAAAAASGIDVNSPTALKLNETISKNSEEDALITIMGGGNSQARGMQQSYLDRQGASIARSEGRMRNTATLINGVSSAAGSYSQWKRAG